MDTENDEIRTLLDQYSTEEKKYKDISSKLQIQLKNLSILFFVKNLKTLKSDLFSVIVKVCDTLEDFEALELSEDVYYDCVIENKNCTFYVVKIFVSYLLRSKLINENWFCCATVESGNCKASKITSLLGLRGDSVLNIVIPFEKSSETVAVKTRFFLPAEDYWPNFEISCFVTDVSYYFVPLYEHKFLRPKQYATFEISKLYASDVELKVHRNLEYMFGCQVDLRRVFAELLGNCMHRLNIAHMQTLLTETDLTDVRLAVNNCESTIALDTQNNVLKVSANAATLHAIKEYLISRLSVERRTVQHMTLMHIKNLRTHLKLLKTENSLDVDNLKAVYEEYKNLLAEFPI